MTDADALLRRAHQAGYRFPADFGGFTATVRTGAGDTGRLTVRGRAAIDLTIDGRATGADATAPAHWARDEIASMVGHRWPTGYEQGDGRWAKRAEGDTVTFLDDPFDSAYKLSDEVISEVHRTVGGTRFVIAVNARLVVDDGRHLPSHFTVFHWSTDSGRLIRAEHFTDEYLRVDGVYLPVERRVVSATDDGLTTRTLSLTEHSIDLDPQTEQSPMEVAADA